MRMSFRLTGVLVVLAAISSCSYSLPPPLQMKVDTLVEQTQGVESVVLAIKARAKAGKIDANALATAKRRYGELVTAHGNWLDNVQRVINNEINNFEGEEKYQNAVAKLETASNEFEKAADAALGAGSVTDVPDWPTEAREMIVRAYNERKMKEAARLIREQLQIARWDEIKN